MLPPRMLYFHLAFGVVLLFGSQKAARRLKTEGQGDRRPVWDLTWTSGSTEVEPKDS
jgi:hypothetical protein